MRDANLGANVQQLDAVDQFEKELRMPAAVLALDLGVLIGLIAVLWWALR